MATVEVEVEVDIEEFDNHELVSEVIDRIDGKWHKLKDSEIKELREALNMETGDFICPSLRETLKYEHLKEIFNQYSLEEIQELLPNKLMKAI